VKQINILEAIVRHSSTMSNIISCISTKWWNIILALAVIARIFYKHKISTTYDILQLIFKGVIYSVKVVEHCS